MESAHLGEKKKRHHSDTEKGERKKRLFMLQSFECAIMVRGFCAFKDLFLFLV